MSIARSLAIRPRVLLAALAGCIAAFVLPNRLPGSICTAIAGDIAALVYLALAFHAMATHSAELLRKRAAQEDDGAVVILIIVLVAIAFSFWSIFGVLNEAKHMSGAAKAEHIALAAATILLSWLVTQAVFTFHYAHEFYRPDDGGEPSSSGLVFPKDPTPTIGISSTSPRPSARPRRLPTSPSAARRCAGSSRCTPSCRSSSTQRCWRSPSISAPA